MNFILVLFFYIPVNGFLYMKQGDPPKLWSFVSSNMKQTSRNWFIKRATNLGIPWKSLTEHYEKNKETLETIKAQYENTSILYPNYYSQSFHGYDHGNLEWKAAFEAEAATLSISANYWDNVSPHQAEQWLRQNATQRIQLYRQKLGLAPFESILDMGCSTGISTQFLKQRFPYSHILGVDLSPYFISTAIHQSVEKLDNNYFMHANIENVPLPNESFDMISIQFVLHEVPYENCLNILNEAYRLLKQDGVLCIMDLNPNILRERFQTNQFRVWAFEVTEPHIYEYYQQNMVQSLEQCGFHYIEECQNDPLNVLYLATKSGVQVQYDYSFPRRHFFGNVPNNKKELTLVFT